MLEKPLYLGPLSIGTPVILAPMAGVTDLPFRRLCREFGESVLDGSQLAATDAPSGLYVMEMVTARALTEGNPETWRMVEPDPTERVRSVQLYGVDPVSMGEATRSLVRGGYADHVDLNFGCPVPKVTKRGGGAALPWKRDLFQAIVRSVVAAADESAPAAGHVPVTVKMRIGIDGDHATALEAGRLAQNAGVSAVSLHARTQEQYYSGKADLEWIARLKDSLNIPVFGNGDIFSASDAERMMDATGCDAVVIGRGCQGRPWLFAELSAALHGKAVPDSPNLAQVRQTILRHAALMVDTMGDELRAMREMRKHIGWYLRGFAVGGETRGALGLVSSYVELEERTASLDLDQPFPASAHGARGRAGSPKRPHLPDGWLDSRDLTPWEREKLHLAEDGGSGG